MGQPSEKITWAGIRGTSHWSPLQGRWVIAELKRSGLGAKRFAAKHKLGIKRIYYWQARVRAESSRAKPGPKLIEVSAPVLGRLQTSSSTARIEIELRSGRRMSVSESISLETLSELVTLLERS